MNGREAAATLSCCNGGGDDAKKKKKLLNSLGFSLVGFFSRPFIHSLFYLRNVLSFVFLFLRKM